MAERNQAVQHVGLQAVSLPSHFSNGDLSQWLDRFETCAAANDWTPEQRLARLPTFLEGRAYNLYRKLQAGQRDNFDNLRINRIELYYPPEARETRRLELCNIKGFPDEEIDQFVYRLEQKFRKAHPEMEGDGFVNIRTDMLKISILSGLPEVYQKKLREIPGLTYVDAQLSAKQLKAADQYETARNSTISAQSTRNATSGSESGRLAAIESKLAALTLSSSLSFAGRDAQIKQESEWRTNAASPFSQPNNTQSSRYYDYNSDQRDRWERARLTNGQTQCYQCGGFGHTKSECPSNRLSSNRTSSNQNRSDSRDRDYDRRNKD